MDVHEQLNKKGMADEWTPSAVSTDPRIWARKLTRDTGSRAAN